MSMQPSRPPVLDPELETPNLCLGDVHREGIKFWTCVAIDSETGDGTWEPILGTFPFDPEVNQTFPIGNKTFKFNGTDWVYHDESNCVASQEYCVDQNGKRVDAIVTGETIQAFLAGLPTEDPEEDGKLWLDNDVLTVSHNKPS